VHKSQSRASARLDSAVLNTQKQWCCNLEQEMNRRSRLLLLTQQQNASVLRYDSVRTHTSLVMHHLPIICPSSTECPHSGRSSAQKSGCALICLLFLLRKWHSAAWLLSKRMCRGHDAAESYHAPRDVRRCLRIMSLLLLVITY